jgi:hypothetical protein
VALDHGAHGAIKDENALFEKILNIHKSLRIENVIPKGLPTV